MFNKKKKQKRSTAVYLCKNRYVTELVGFEGDFKQACCHKGHQDAGQYFAECCTDKCPEGKYD